MTSLFPSAKKKKKKKKYVHLKAITHTLFTTANNTFFSSGLARSKSALQSEFNKATRVTCLPGSKTIEKGLRNQVLDSDRVWFWGERGEELLQ